MPLSPHRSSPHLDDRRHLVPALEDGRAGQVDAEPEGELAGRRGQPVGFTTGGRGVLQRFLLPVWPGVLRHRLHP